MVVRKLTANPPARNESLSDLAIQLNELCETYLNPRLLAREKHGAVALNAVMVSFYDARSPRGRRDWASPRSRSDLVSATRRSSCLPTQGGVEETQLR